MGTQTAPDTSLRQRLLQERSALLDLSTRNRLLDTPLRTRNNRAIEIVDEKAAEVFRLLDDGKSMTFLPGVALADRTGLDPDDKETGGIPQPEDDAPDARGVAARHADLRLQTRLTSEGLQKRLFDIWYDARTLEEEQGVNILYLALGLLRWYDENDPDKPRHAPLVLLPVALERSSASEKFRLKGRGEPPSPNITLQAKLKEFKLAIGDFPDEEELDLAAYCAGVAQAVAKEPRWQVLPDAMVLGFFSFAKFLMYRDLDPELWPQQAPLDKHPLVTALLRDGFAESAPLIADNSPIDPVIPPLEQNHVVDADSSQAVAIAEAAAGRTLVVKGPPGTGKSQTITNIIAGAVARGRKVLFVSEKMAALDVVWRRLQQAGLGALTLQLHSNKANKRALLEELRQTKEAVAKPPRGDLSVMQKLGDAGESLNRFADRMHVALSPCGLTPYQVLARLVWVNGLNAPGGFVLDGAAGWTPSDAAQRQAMVREIAERLAALGPVPQHVWRGVRREALDPAEREDLMRAIGTARKLLDDAVALAGIATDQLGAPRPVTLADLSASLDYLACADTLPHPLPAAALAHPAWSGDPALLQAVVDMGLQWRRAREQIGDSFNAAGWRADFLAIRTALVTKGGSLLRFLDGDYRARIALLKSYLTRPLPAGAQARIALVDTMIAAQEARAAFDAVAPAGAAFGTAWLGEASDWSALAAIVAWRKACRLPISFWTRLAAVTDFAVLRTSCNGLAAGLPALAARLQALFANLMLDLRRAFGVAALEAVPLAALDERLAAWQGDGESITRFIAFAARGRELARLGGTALVEAVQDGLLTAETLPPAFERAYAEALRGVLFTAWPELRAFDGDSQDRLVAGFRDLDRARIELAKEQIAWRHAEQRPKGAGGIGPLGALNAELAKKRGHLPIRQLLDKAGPAIQQLKPVFMMSPLSVAQFLKPGGLSFDLLVMDEASQIEPVDAMGAIARAGQLVVVGDAKQLPPTAFFKKLTGEDEPEDEDGIPIRARDAESILDLCLAKGAPSRLLNWHYRSRHQSLIAVSNQQFYDNKLFIVPSPYDAVAGMGLKFHLLKDTAYDRGGTRTNPGEARVVAEAVIRHARDNPGQSLGVGTFSVAQRQAVLAELEKLRRASPELEEFFSTSRNDPFFVKNLENIQGDERDVIFISIGYGKTAQGQLAHAFGPLSGEGGERRLNVLISRARLRCEVFCNFTGADIDLERTRAAGVVALKLFLTFAETGKFEGGGTGSDSQDGGFEALVCDALRARGHDVKTDIGASGFRIDLAVADAQKPGRFVLGIECDGAQYHAARSARDRDRLRRQVLEAQGWILHRLWSADWYMRPQEELRKLEAAIAAAQAEWRDRDETAAIPARAVPLAFETQEDGEGKVITPVVGDPAPPPARVLYQEAAFAVDRTREPHEVPLADMAAIVVKIVQAEGPVHIDEVTTRIRELWGLQRAGTRIRAAVAAAMAAATGRGLLAGDPFLAIPGQAVTVRDRSQVASSSLRKPEMLPPDEIDAALLKVVTDNFGAGRADLAQAAARLFGYQMMGAQLRAVLEEGIVRLVADGRLVEKDALLVGAAGKT